MKKSLPSIRAQCRQRARKRLIYKYEELPSFYHVKVINDILCDEQSHFVAMFKEYLIYEEMNEFLKRYYTYQESSYKIVRILQFFEKYSKIYPNYTKIPASKYIYKNIKRKQKMIDHMQNNSDNSDMGDPSKNCSDMSLNIFTTNALQSINSVTQSLYQNNSRNDCNALTENDNENEGNDSSEGIRMILEKIEKIENKKELKKKDIIGVKRKSLLETNVVLSPKSVVKIDLKIKMNEANGSKSTIKQQLQQQLQQQQQQIISQKSKIPNSEIILSKIEKLPLTTHTTNSLSKNGGTKSERLTASISHRKPVNHTAMNSLNKRQQKINSNIHDFPNNNNHKTNVLNSYNKHTILNNNSQKKNKSNSKGNSNITPNISTKISTKCKAKIFSPRNSIQVNYPHTQNTSLDKKSRSIPKNNNQMGNNGLVCSHIQQNSGQINLSNGGDLLKSLKLNPTSTTTTAATAKSVLQSAATSQTVKNNKKQTNKLHPKFELNLRKIMHKNIIEVESVSDRSGKVNLIDRLGINYLNESRRLHKLHSTANSKANITENRYKHISYNSNSNSYSNSRQGHSMKMKKKINTKNFTSNNSTNTSKLYNNITNNNHNHNSSNSRIKNQNGNNTTIIAKQGNPPHSKVKLKNLYAINKLLKNNFNPGLLTPQFHSERNKKAKITLK